MDALAIHYNTLSYVYVGILTRTIVENYTFVYVFLALGASRLIYLIILV